MEKIETITIKRRNEIAYLYVVEMIRRDIIPTYTPGSIRREVGNVAEKLEIPVGEAEAFASELISSLVEKTFPEPKVEEIEEQIEHDALKRENEWMMMRREL